MAAEKAERMRLEEEEKARIAAEEEERLEAERLAAETEPELILPVAPVPE